MNGSAFRTVLYENHAIIRAPAPAKLDVHFALHVHEYESTGKANSHHDKLSPEGPLEDAFFDLHRCSVYQHIQGPDDTRDGDDMERHGAHDLPPLHGRHLKLLPLKREVDSLVWLFTCLICHCPLYNSMGACDECQGAVVTNV